MAAAPMYVQQRVVGVLNLASKDPHAFDRRARRGRCVWGGGAVQVLAAGLLFLLLMLGLGGGRWRGCSAFMAAGQPPTGLTAQSIHLPACRMPACRSRLVWLLALVLAPFVAALEWTSQVLEIEAFVQRIMPPLLEQNYQRNTQQRRAPAGTSSGATNSAAASSAAGAKAGKGASRRERHHVDGGGAAPAGRATGGSEAECGGGGVAAAAAAKPPAGSDQFAQNAEVLITGAGGRGGAAPGSDALAPDTPACSNSSGDMGAEGGAVAPAAPAADRVLLPRSNSASSGSSAGNLRAKASKAARGSSAAKVCLGDGWVPPGFWV